MRIPNRSFMVTASSKDPTSDHERYRTIRSEYKGLLHIALRCLKIAGSAPMLKQLPNRDRAESDSMSVVQQIEDL